MDMTFVNEYLEELGVEYSELFNLTNQAEYEVEGEVIEFLPMYDPSEQKAYEKTLIDSYFNGNLEEIRVYRLHQDISVSFIVKQSASEVGIFYIPAYGSIHHIARKNQSVSIVFKDAEKVTARYYQRIHHADIVYENFEASWAHTLASQISVSELFTGEALEIYGEDIVHIPGQKIYEGKHLVVFKGKYLAIKDGNKCYSISRNALKAVGNKEILDEMEMVDNFID